MCTFSLFVAYSFAEICSAFPVAGGQYSWTALLSSQSFARPFSYVCGWFIVIGLFPRNPITTSFTDFCPGFLSAGAANGFIGANFVLGIAQLCNPSYTIERWHTCLLTYLVLILAAAVNIWGRRALEPMGRIMIIFNLVSFMAVVVTVLATNNQKQSADFVFKDFQNFSGFGTANASLLGLLQAAFGMTGYDATARA